MKKFYATKEQAIKISKLINFTADIDGIHVSLKNSDYIAQLSCELGECGSDLESAVVYTELTEYLVFINDYTFKYCEKESHYFIEVFYNNLTIGIFKYYYSLK